MTRRFSIEAVNCPRCATSLNLRVPEIRCSNCGRGYPRLGTIPVLLRDPQTYLRSCRQQLALLETKASQTIQVIEGQLQMPDLVPGTKARLNAMIDAVRGQTADIREILAPVLESSDDTPPDVPANEVPAPLTCIHYLYRDWGWPSDPNGENERALAAMESIGSKNVGRMLVIGAGACRLAYDLHRQDPHADTTVLDIDPFLFLTAQAVIGGRSIRMREANVEIAELGSVMKDWMLQAPRGTLNADAFHFLLADGLETPFASGTFDTILTPWFIDLVPSDLRNFMSEVHRLLKPGGRWLNFGPLRYRSDVPITRRFAREEIFDLATRAGFRVGKWQTESTPYLVSKLNGRGKMEWVLAFGATKLETPPEAAPQPPAWLLFRHLPIPAFHGLSNFTSEDPAEQIVASAIDGTNTLDDIARFLASKAGHTGLSMDQFREIVRRCLVDIHPDVL